MTSVLSPMTVHWEESSLFTAHCTLSWGPTWGGRGEHVCGGVPQHRAADKLPKVNGGHAAGTCWAPWLFTGIDDFVLCRRCLNCPCGMPSRPPACQNQLGVMWQYWTICRSSKLGLPGPHYMIYSEQPTLIFNSGLMCSSVLNFTLD